MVDNLLQRLQSEPTPLIDGERVTFVWKGSEPPALRGDFNNWQAVPAGEWTKATPKHWTYSLDCPTNAYLEYCFGEDEERQPDPFNPRKTSNGMGFTNHCFFMPEGAPSLWAIRDKKVPRGTITTHKIETYAIINRRWRTVHFYQPPVQEPVPLLLVYDGRDYKNRARLPIIVDNLIAAGKMAPVALALLPNAGLGRTTEYACSEAMLLFLTHRLLPLVKEHLNLVSLEEQPGAYSVMGASMGGMMAMFTSLRLPHIFGSAYSQSGAFEFGPYQSLLFDLIKIQPLPKPKLYLDVGRYEWLLEPNRRMRTALNKAGFNFTYREYNAGHNYPSWRDNLHRGLSWLFPPTPEEPSEPQHSEKRAVNIWGKEYRKV